MRTAQTRTSTPDEAAHLRFGAWRHLPKAGRRAFVGAFGGYGLDAFDYQVLPLTLAAITAYFRISSGEAGLLNSVTLVVSALGGLLAGILADRIGRTRTLMITIGTYAVFTLLCGLAPNFGLLLTFRALQGLGFGGEWAVGAVLVAEYASPRYRGRVAALIQSSWAVGWAVAVIVYTLVFDLASPAVGWRIMFMTGVLPALFVWYLRRKVVDAPRPAAENRPRGGVLTDRIGRKANFAVFAVAAAVLLVAYSLVPPGANELLLVLGFPLGFAYSAIFSGFGAFLAELYPVELRATGQGFTYNFGRAVGAVFPASVGFMANTFGIGGAMAFGARGYGIAVLALFGLPETRERTLT